MTLCVVDTALYEPRVSKNISLNEIPEGTFVSTSTTGDDNSRLTYFTRCPIEMVEENGKESNGCIKRNVANVFLHCVVEQ